MPPQQRRAAIVEAAVGLLETQGPDLTTKQIAEAAGVAEGTLFRVFATLSDLLEAAYAEYLSAERLRKRLQKVDLGDNVETATLAAVRALVDYITSVHFALHPMPSRGCEPPSQSEAGPRTFHARFNDLDAWLGAALTPYASRLRFPVPRYAKFLQTLAIGHAMSRQPADSIPDIAQFALHGALLAENPPETDRNN